MPPRYPPPKKGHFPPGFIMPVLPDLAPVVLCAPSGGGKTTLNNRLKIEFSDFIAHSVSHTTRAPRVGEVDGVDYHFVNEVTMQNIIQSGQLLEYTKFSGNIYGTSKKTVEDILQSGKICLLTLDINGCDVIRRTYKGAKLIFLMPPSKKELEFRIKSRSDASVEDIEARLERADIELAYAEQPGKFDLVLINDDLEKCYIELVHYLRDLLNLAKEKRKQAEIMERVVAFKERRIQRLKLKQSNVVAASFDITANFDVSDGTLTSGHGH